MYMKSMLSFILTVSMVLMVAAIGLAQLGTVKNYQKISATEGDFNGALDDGDIFGSSLTALGDLDGDGVSDVAVGASGDDDGGSSRGAVWVLFLKEDDTVKDYQKISEFQGNFNGTLDDLDQFGSSLTALGDLDGDGVTDLAVGAENDEGGGESRGAVWVLFLKEDGTVKSHQKISDTQGNFNGILDDSDFFGSSVTALGDLDGDGVPDMAVGASWDDDSGENRGAVWVLVLKEDGTVKNYQKISDTQGNFNGTLDDSDFFGSSVTALGDLDGDGVPDMAVGATYDDDGGQNRGAAWVLFLNDVMPPLPPSSINYPSSSSSGSYTVSWPSSSGATSYQLERSSNGGNSWSRIYTGSGTSRSENVGDGNYRYRVRAANSVGSSSWRTGTYDCAVAISTTDVEDFVTRFYQMCLGRGPDRAGLDGWVKALLDGSQTGSDVAYGFVFSTEFLNQNTTDQEYLQVLYRAFFNRQPDAGGMQGWLDAMASGVSREDVLKGFIYATEFNELCREYDIMPNPVAAFVTRFYQLCLKRDPDIAGLDGWVSSLLSGANVGADVAEGFIFSPEFTKSVVTDEEYITILYKAFFNRNPDQAGLQGWLDVLSGGTDRAYVLDGFIYSQEFAQLCKKYNITPF
jgi:hypothetical protein